MKLFQSVLALMVSFSSLAQSPINIPTTKIELKGHVHSNGWQIYLSDLDYKIEYQFVDCDPSIGYDQEMVILRFTNRTSETLTFNWHILSDYEGVCITCDYPDEYGYSVKLEPHEEKEGDCSIYEAYNLKIFSKFIDENYTKGDQLTGFQLGNLTLLTIE